MCLSHSVVVIRVCLFHFRVGVECGWPTHCGVHLGVMFPLQGGYQSVEGPLIGVHLGVIFPLQGRYWGVLVPLCGRD